jgi:hypothetical protein
MTRVALVLLLLLAGCAADRCRSGCLGRDCAVRCDLVRW